MPRICTATIMCFLIAAGSASAQGRAPLEPRFSAELQTRDLPAVNSLVNVELRVTANLTSPELEIELPVPEGVLLASGSSRFSVSLRAGETLTRTFAVRFARSGVYHLQARLSDTTSVANPKALKHAVASLSFAVGRSSGFASREFDERFTAPGLRSVKQLLSMRDQLMPLDVPVRPGEIRYGGTPPDKEATALGAELIALREKDVDAVLEDSVAQANRIYTALRADQARPRNLQPSSRQPDLTAASSMSCPPGYWSRPGQLLFDNQNLPVPGEAGLPGMRIEAWQSPLRSGLYAIFYTQEDGSFPADACFPVDGNGWTHIFLFQENGYALLKRDGASDETLFPQGLQTWDLTQSSFLNLRTRHPEASYILHTLRRAASYGNSAFGFSRDRVNVWYFNNVDTDYYCPFYSVFVCTKPEEAIYLHRFNPTAQGPAFPMVWTDFGQFTIAHEFGHAYERHALENNNGGCDGPHQMQNPNGLTCAMNEGFADFYSVFTLQPERFGHRFNAEHTNFAGTANRGPEIEGAVMTYLYDLVDGSSYPASRPAAWGVDDDPITISPNHLARVIREGLFVGEIPADDNRTIVDFIGILEAINPIPNKPEFASYFQPTTLYSAPPPPIGGGWSTSNNAHLWRWSLFRTAPPVGIGFAFIMPALTDFVVSAGAPASVTVKTTYPLNGSANQSAYGWQWNRSDNGGQSHYYWATGLNSQFIAYAGAYSIFWKLNSNRASDGVAGLGQTTTQVCVAVSGCTPEFSPVVTPTGATPERDAMPSGHGDPRITQRDATAAESTAVSVYGDHYGSGVWLGSLTPQGPRVAQLYSLAGAHSRAESAWPNLFAPDGRIQNSRAGTLPVRVTVSQDSRSASSRQ